MRARNLKPSLFVNELLAFAPPLHTVIFAGLWCVADRRGVLEDRPQRIHTLINPGRSLSSTKASLSWLHDRGFIVRYQVGNIHLIKVLNFEKHQNPHRDERASELPDYGANTVLNTNSAQCQHAANTVPAEKSTESARLIPSSLIPDSGFLIPDPPLPEHRAAPGKRGGGHSNKGKPRYVTVNDVELLDAHAPTTEELEAREREEADRAQL